MLQLLVAGLALGSLYAAAALVYNLQYSATRVLSVTTGHMFMVGAVVGAFLIGQMKLPAAVAIPITILAGALLGYVTEVVAIKRMLGRSDEHLWLLSTLGLATIIQEIAALTWGAEPRPFPRLIPQDYSAGVFDQKYWLPIGFVIALTVGLQLFLRHTMLGKVFLATAEDAFAARARGIPIGALRSLAFALAGGASALGGMMAGQLTFAYFATGLSLTLNGFIALAVGGIGSSMGALIGGLMLGLFAVFGASFFGNEYQQTISVGLLVMILIVKPEGLIPNTRLRAV